MAKIFFEVQANVYINKLLEDQTDVGKTLCFVDDDRIGLAKGEFDIS